MERIGVIRENGVVINAILWNDGTPSQLLSEGITDFEEVTGREPRPGIGWTWDKSNGFRSPKPYASWKWNVDRWQAPIAEPTEGGPYKWNEETQSWDQVEPQV